MKAKIYGFSFLIALLCVFNSCKKHGHNIASTDPENKNVVLEEYTGIYCGWCPDGHVRAKELHDAHPDDVVIIAIHEGYSSSSNGENFTTEFGGALEAQINYTGYPTGTINRHNFSAEGWDSDGGTAMSRSYWDNAADVILAESSYVNVAAEHEVGTKDNDRELTIYVEAYYTGDMPSGGNVINVALLQSNVEGPQSGMASNPDYVLSNGNYSHQHMLRHLITGQWGEDISDVSKSTYRKTFTYVVPDDLNGVAYDLSNLDIAVFVAEGQQEIITGCLSSLIE